jgi:peptidoglycan/LPS O-acetylase OafA/YrhL
MASDLLAPTIAPNALGNFLYFWLPNQLDVFILGMALYFLIGDSSPQAVRRLNYARPYRYWFAGIAVIGFLSASFVPRYHYIGAGTLIPETLFISVPLVIFAVALASGPTIFVNRPIQEIGKVSFSAYLLHFAALDLFERFPSIFHVKATGVSAIAVFAIDLIVLSLGVYGCSYLLCRGRASRHVVGQANNPATVGSALAASWKAKSLTRFARHNFDACAGQGANVPSMARVIFLQCERGVSPTWRSQSWCAAIARLRIAQYLPDPLLAARL